MKATDWLAIYGAALSTIVFGWNVSRTLRRLKVSLNLGAVDAQIGYYITIANHSSSPANARYLGLLIPYRKVSFREASWQMLRYQRHWRRTTWVHIDMPKSVSSGLPLVIEAGDSHGVFVPVGAMHSKIASAQMVSAYVQDALDRNFYSKPMERIKKG